MTAHIMANRLLESDAASDLDSPEMNMPRYNDSGIPGIEVERKSNHWNVYKERLGTIDGLVSHLVGEIYYGDMLTAPVDKMSPEALAFHDAHRWTAIWGFRERESAQCKSFEEALKCIVERRNINLAQESAESLDPDDPELYTKPEVHNKQPELEQIISSLRCVFNPYYDKVEVQRQYVCPTFTVYDKQMYPCSIFKWTVHCTRSKSIPLPSYARNGAGALEWMPADKWWLQATELIEVWASKQGIHYNKGSMKHFGRLRLDPTFTFETTQLGGKQGVTESEDDLPADMELKDLVGKLGWTDELAEVLSRFHPYGIGSVNVMGGNSMAIITVRTYFDPNGPSGDKENYAASAKEFISKWMLDHRITPKIDPIKAYAAKDADREYPRWTLFIVVNTSWTPGWPELGLPV